MSGLKLMAEIGLDGSGFERGLHKMGEEAGRSVKALAVQAFGIYGIEQAIAKTVETATDLVNESKRLDVTVEQLQLLRQAAKDGGTEMGTLASAFEKLDVARAKALGGDKGALNAFAKLGVGQDALKNQTAATLFTTQISAAVKGGSVESLAPALKEILGKGFGEIIPVLKTDFDELGDKMKRLGSIMDTETAVKLKAIGDNFDLLKNILAVQLAPALLTFVETILTIIGKIKQFGAFLGGAGVGDQEHKHGVLHDFFLGEKIDVKDFLKRAREGKKESDKVGDEWKKTIQALRDKLKKEADDLKNPKPINTADGAIKSAAVHHARVQSDALVKVGNFLGSNGQTISRVDQQKIGLMKEHLAELKGIKHSIGQGVGPFGLGIPQV